MAAQLYSKDNFDIILWKFLTVVAFDSPRFDTEIPSTKHRDSRPLSQPFWCACTKSLVVSSGLGYVFEVLFDLYIYIMCSPLLVFESFEERYAQLLDNISHCHSVVRLAPRIICKNRQRA